MLELYERINKKQLIIFIDVINIKTLPTKSRFLCFTMIEVAVITEAKIENKA